MLVTCHAPSIANSGSPPACPRNTPTIRLAIDLGWLDGACRLGRYYQARPFIAPTALVGTLRAPQKPSRSQLLRGVLVDHDVLYGGEALLDGIMGALGYRVGIYQPQLPINGYLGVHIYLVAEFARA